MSTSPPTPDGAGRTSVDLFTDGAAIDPRRSESIHRLVVLGYIMAFAIPPMGLILGVVLAIRDSGVKSKYIAGMIALSIVATVVWVVILNSGVVNTTNTD
jgi:hypothetical protein